MISIVSDRKLNINYSKNLLANISDRIVNYIFKKEMFSFNLTFQITLVRKEPYFGLF